MNIHDFACVSVGAFIGVLLRILCRTIYDVIFHVDFRHISPMVVTTIGGPLFRDVISNILGCVGMGIISTFKKDKFFAKYTRWYALIATGVMGSLTTFSSWNGESSIKFWAGYNVADGVFALLVGFSTSYLALLFGMQIGKSIRICSEYHSGAPEQVAQDEDSDHSSHSSIDRSLRFATWALFGASIVGFIILSAVLSESGFRSIPIACIGGAVGACVRFALSTKLNPKRPKFPLGTFLCNILGSVSYIAVVVSLRLRTSDLSTIDVVNSLVLLGFTGGLTTVSSFMLELHSLSPASAWVYGSCTILVTQFLLLLFNSVYYLVTE
eukprot:TRINITY_DN16170_c0_g1_i1.p1 TRINITY_DN16170_c0_g1~~TRINITY_DN16170_c0_g1_i1.p1  ORF type:complete len:325 (+),score=11.83 TRINITY_DN16170_c0_g1_i1:22-996(+)